MRKVFVPLMTAIQKRLLRESRCSPLCVCAAPRKSDGCAEYERQSLGGRCGPIWRCMTRWRRAWNRDKLIGTRCRLSGD